MPRRRKGKRPIDSDRVEQAVAARGGGATLRQAAAAAGVHVATLCRWQIREPWIGQALRDAEQCARSAYYASRPYGRPNVPWRRDCPDCGAQLRVLSAHGYDGPAVPPVFRTLLRGHGGYVWGLRFWRCSRWPACRFASWRPRALGDCLCGGALLWSHSRKTVVCRRCGQRTRVGAGP